MESDTDKISLSLRDHPKLAAAFAGTGAGDTIKITDIEFIIDEVSSDIVIGSIEIEEIGEVTVESKEEEDAEHESGYENQDESAASSPVVSVMGGYG